MQGDVIKLIEADGTVVAEYTYNARGEILSITDADGNAITSATHIANINPLRYRGYYYDTETGFYYLQSRYYDPAMHRFINADSLASTGQGIVGTNMFAYCLNNPLIYIDVYGTNSKTLDWLSSQWWLCFADSVLPIGDVIYIIGTCVCFLVDIINLLGLDNIVRFATDASAAAEDFANNFSSGASNPQPPEDPFRSWTAANFRYNLQQLTGELGTGQQAHHIFPQKFIDNFSRVGINIHDPKYGAWVESHAHAGWSYAYNQDWFKFFDQNPNASYSEIIDFVRGLSERYGFALNF